MHGFLKRCFREQVAIPVVLLTLFCSTLFSQELKFNHITSAEGLSQAVVNCVVKDKKGFMWFGTQDGLNRYDGYTITVFRHDPEDPNSLTDNFINCLYVDEHNTLWVGTNSGLDAYNSTNNIFSHYDASAKSHNVNDNTIRAIFPDKDGSIWLGTEMGLMHFDPAKGSFTTADISNENLSVRAILRDKQNRLWFCTYGFGLYQYDPSTGKYHDYDLTFNNDAPPTALDKANNTRTLFLDKQGKIYVGTNGGGLLLFDPGLGKVIKTCVSSNDLNDLEHLAGNTVTSIDEDEEGFLWIGSMNYGLSRFNPATQKFKVYRHSVSNPSSLGNDNVRFVYMDDQKNLWFGTNGGGVDVYFKSAIKFKHFLMSSNPDFSFISNNIYSIIQDYDGLLWIGAFNGGLISYDMYTGQMVRYPDYINSGNSTVTALYQDRDSLIWTGTYGSGLSCFNKRTGKVRHFTGDGQSKYQEETSPIKNGTITCITSDDRGLIWIATLGAGVYCYDKRKDEFYSYRTTNGLSSDLVYNIYQDRSGNMWVGTQNGGACVLDFRQKKVVASYKAVKNGSGLSSNKVNHFFEDLKGGMWIATAQGLDRLDKKSGKFTSYFIKDGLANDYIYSILPDAEGNLWMSTNKGITRFDPKMENKEGSAFRNFDRNDGLQDDEFAQGAFYKNQRTGLMFFGGLNGFNTFDPAHISNNQHVPPVFITSYKRFGKEVKLDSLIEDKRYIELSYKDNFFSFEFVALDYVFPEKNRYMYKMEGLDQDWSPATNHRYASYTNLEGGDYVFRVKGCNNDGTWNEEGVALHITIHPPFWKTKMFYALCVIIGIALVFGYTRWRTASIEREKKVLEGKVEERTAELAQKNKDITASIQYAKRIQLAILPPVHQVKTHLPSSFILYKPKDIVSGDFYWFGEKNGKKIIAAVDCTGHGVPGAFMRMIGNNLLNQIIIEKGITEPGEILNALNLGVQNSLKQGSNEIETSDGMDVALCTIDTTTREVKFAGAYRPMLIVSNGMLEKVEGNKFPIGGKQMDNERNFRSHTRIMQPGDTIYLFSDGYADQFGGPKGKKFMVKRMDELILGMQQMDMNGQEKMMDETIEGWRGTYQQVDDILVIGIRF